MTVPGLRIIADEEPTSVRREYHMIEYATSSLFDSPAQALVNTVNTVGVMGKGIASTFKKLYPDMFRQYRRLCEDRRLTVGKLYIYRTPNKIIVNFPTKQHWRSPSQASYLKAGLEKFVEYYADYGITSVSFPQLGCGNGELDWKTQVHPLMKRYLRPLPIPVYIHLYAESAEFVPERFDPAYAREVMLERQRVSMVQVWTDLQAVAKASDRLEIFGPLVEVDDERIVFRALGGEPAPVTVYREDVEALWNLLRLRGTVHEKDVPTAIDASGATEWLFALLQRIDYIRSIKTAAPGTATGLRYAPLPSRCPSTVAEILV